MPNLRIAFIDSKVNIEYISQLINEKQKIADVYQIDDEGKAMPAASEVTRNFTHATMCAKKFLDHYLHSCELIFLEIMDEIGTKTNIHSLLAALNWCGENKINLINLSIGTTSLFDISPLHQTIEKLVLKNIIIVAASSNRNKMTFPAVFSNVLGVKSLNSRFKKNGHLYFNNYMDEIEVGCFIAEEAAEYNHKHYIIPCSNSIAAPVVSAKICNLMCEDYGDLPLIRKRLKRRALPGSHYWFKKRYHEYFKKEINIPVIAIIEDEWDLSQELLSLFSNYGYKGICLSNKHQTDITLQTINLQTFKSYSIAKKIRFYSHYCNADFLAIHINDKKIFKKLTSISIDIVVNNSNRTDYKINSDIMCLKRADYKNNAALLFALRNILSGRESE